MQTPAHEPTTANTSKGSARTSACLASPKRKREADDVQGQTQSPNHLRTDLPTAYQSDYPKHADPTSPRSKIGEELKKLSINFDIPPPDFKKSKDTRLSPPPRILSPHHIPTYSSSSVFNSNVAQEQSTAHPQQAAPAVYSATATVTQQAPIASTSVSSALGYSSEAIPLTQSLNPLLASSTMSFTNLGSESKKKEGRRASRTRSPSPTINLNQSSDLVWTAQEITGDNPTDPTDDGYGMNGIGFRPTPSMAQVRAQKRRQQIADWRSREAKEARQRRFDRRKDHDQSMAKETESKSPTRKVRFVED